MVRSGTGYAVGRALGREAGSARRVHPWGAEEEPPMARAHSAESLATRVFIIVMIGIGAEIAAMVLFGF